MKKVYFGIKCHSDNRNRDTIEAIERCLNEQGLSTYCVVRDMENWGQTQFSAKKLMDRTFLEIDQSVAVVLEMTEKGVGLGIEAGYARAKNIPLIVLVRKGIEISTTLSGIANDIIEYENFSDIDLKLSV